ncbi:MAG: hypothetical protein JOY82_12030 [Streptosporangiaceae bacterium]|nr:hypothetical protein [Streptosporangiaceae bacterium]
MTPVRLAELLNLLEAAGAVRLGRRIEQAADSPAPAEAASKAAERARLHRSAERSRVEMMRRYAEMTDRELATQVVTRRHLLRPR